MSTQPRNEALTEKQAVPGTICTLLYDDQGPLYRIDSVKDGKVPTVSMTSQSGRSRTAKISTLQKTDRPFPAQPGFVPKPGMFVTTDRIGSWTAKDVLLVVKPSSSRMVHVMALDGSGDSATVPYAALRQVKATVALPDEATGPAEA